MPEITRYGLILALICVLAAGLLAGVNLLTQDKIIAQAKAEEEMSLKEVVPDGERFLPVKSGEETLYYQAYDAQGKLSAFAFKTKAKGYSSTIETMAGMTKDGAITFIKIFNQNETPGIGIRIIEREFGARFCNQKDIDQVQAISGATISSQAVINSVKKKAEEIRALIQNE